MYYKILGDALLAPADTTAFVTGVLGWITSNVPAILAFLIFAVGLRVARGFLNRSKHGKI